MKTTIKAKAGDFKFATWSESKDYIFKYKKYNLRCEILDEKMKLFSYDYILLLEGKKTDIDAYISFLRITGFSIK